MMRRLIPILLLTLAATTACGPCLEMQACLSQLPDTGDTGEDTGDTATSDASHAEDGAVLDRVLARDVLPADVAARLRDET